MITLTWYKSFKLNIIKFINIINFKIRRTNYDKIRKIDLVRRTYVN